MHLIKHAVHREIYLKERLLHEQKKQKTFREHLVLANDSEQSLFKRFFEINRQLIQLPQLF